MWPLGTKVECILGGPLLTEGSVYTVTGYSQGPARCPITGRAEFGVFLAEVDGRDIGFTPNVLRPVVERKTDISIFTAMLSPAKKAAETVGFLAFMGMICWGFIFIDATGGQ